MRKTHWISLSIALVIAGLFAFLEQRRSYYFLGALYHPVTFQSEEAKAQEQALEAKEDASLDKKLAALMQRAENFWYDARFKFRGDEKPNPAIVLIAIDDESLKSLHQWPWPRGLHARLIRTLEADPPKALLFDVFFVEPFNLDPDGDRALVRATRDNPWVVHSLFYWPNEGPIQRLELPFPALLAASGNMGYANALIDDDGVLRHVFPRRKVQDQTLNFMALIGAAAYLGKPVEEVLARVPLDDAQRMLVHYVGKDFTYPYYSYADVLSKKIPPSTFAGKVVYVGSRATGTFDHYPTPLSKSMPGVEFHANVMDNLIAANAMKTAPLKVTYAAIAFFGIFCGVLLARYSAGMGALGAVGGCLAYMGAAQWLFTSKNLVIDMAGPLYTLGGGYLATVVYRFFTEEREKRLVKGFFSQQVSSELLDVLMANPDVLKKAGERREMTALFSDVAGFTSISERLEPEDLVELLNRYLTAMTDVIFKQGGYVDKYMGDGIMAFWNGLLKQPQHAEQACRCALESMRRLKELNGELEKRGLVPLKARIGVNTGVMVAGYMGSDQKKQYTIMGDNVNLASRLEGANKSFGTSIMISEFTCEAVQDLFEMRFLDIIRVPGKARPVKTYELLGEKGSVDTVWAEVLPVYHQAIQEFGAQEFETARRKFLEVLKILGHDKPCETYILRAEAFLAAPPAKDWDGVFELKVK